MIGYIIAICTSVVSAILVQIIVNLLKTNDRLRDEKKQSEKNKEKAIADGVLLLLKIQLIEYHDKYMKGSNVPTHVYENFDEMYTAYAALGGNGMVKKMKEDIDELRLGGNK